MVVGPKHNRDAMRSRHREGWMKAMTEALEDLNANGVWEVCVCHVKFTWLHRGTQMDSTSV
ncbi:hypothetical protein PI125_g22249 [Phytophthora idaei]|nr:hypothetical protein PI125_g22249 [Phytophthora idaei]